MSTAPPAPGAAPPGGPAPTEAAGGGRAVTSLVFGILGIVPCGCGIFAPFAWWLGASELGRIRAGRSAPKNDGVARAGMILGIIGTVMLAFGLCWLFLLGGLAMLRAMIEAAQGM